MFALCAGVKRYETLLTEAPRGTETLRLRSCAEQLVLAAGAVLPWCQPERDGQFTTATVLSPFADQRVQRRSD